MIRLFNNPEIENIESLLERDAGNNQNVDSIVADILAEVNKNGDAALKKYTKKFDGAELDLLEVTEKEISDAVACLDSDFIDILKEAKENIWTFHEKQKRTGFVMTEKPGVVLGQKITPLDRVGIYVPGGTASYPSTVLMDAIPAKIAGVGEIIMTTPPDKDGSINADILAAAKIAGVDRIFKLGGAQAVAALAYGTQSVPKVDKIVGPGNIFVATAKRMVYGFADIDMIAGPSEILVIADESANPEHVAIDMLSQAEHDKLAAAFLVTTSMQIAEDVKNQLAILCENLPRREIAQAAIQNNSAIIVTDTLENAVNISNIIAPEHLEVCVDEPFALLPIIKHAGSIFLGKYAPEALGDYFAGPNHTLPTSGTARFSSPLSVDDYIKKSSFIYYEKEALGRVYKKIDKFARREGLDAHADSVSIRFK